MKKLYLIRREDVFIAIAIGELSSDSVLECGSIWGIVSLNDDEKNKYSFPICNY